MKETAKKSPRRPPGRPSKPDPVTRQVIGSRVPVALYQKIAEAAASNRRTMAVEIERRLEKTFEADTPNPENELPTFWRSMMAAFEAGGRRRSLTDTQREVSPREWMQDPAYYTDAASRVLETLVDWHPKPTFGLCLVLIYALRARLDRAWMSLLNDTEDEEERRKMIEHAEGIARHMTPPPPPPSLLDPLPKPRGEKDED